MCRTITESGVPDQLSYSFSFLVGLLTLITVLLQRLRCTCAVTAERNVLSFSLDLVFDSLLQWKHLQCFVGALC